MNSPDSLELCRRALDRCRRGGDAAELVSALEALQKNVPSPHGSPYRHHDDPELATKRRLHEEAVDVVARLCSGDLAAPALAVALPLLGGISRSVGHQGLFLDRFGHPDPGVRAAAALGLVRLSWYAYPSPLHRPLLELANGDPVAQVRASVVRILWIADPAYRRPVSGLPRRLLHIALHDPDAGVRAAAGDEIERYCRLGNPFAREHARLIGRRSFAHLSPPWPPEDEQEQEPADDPWTDQEPPR